MEREYLEQGPTAKKKNGIRNVECDVDFVRAPAHTQTD